MGTVKDEMAPSNGSVEQADVLTPVVGSAWDTPVNDTRKSFITERQVLDINKILEADNTQDPFDEPGVIKVMLAEPSQGQIDVLAHDNRKDFLMELSHVRHNSKFRFFSGTTGRMLVTFARETFAEESLRLGMDWILFVDDDMVLPRKMFLGLARHMDNADIIAPLCFRRVHPYHPVLYNVRTEERDGTTYANIQGYLEYPPNKVFEVDAVGFGVVLIRTEILKKVPKPWFFSNTSIGEDIHFCLRARKYGFKTLCDSRVKVGHLGIPPCITELDFIKANKDRLKELHKEELAALLQSEQPVVSSDLGKDDPPAVQLFSVGLKPPQEGVC